MSYDEVIRDLDSIREFFPREWLSKVENLAAEGKLSTKLLLDERPQEALMLLALFAQANPPEFENAPLAAQESAKAARMYIESLAPSLLTSPAVQELARITTGARSASSNLGDPFDDISAIRATPNFLVTESNALFPLIRVDISISNVARPVMLNLHIVDVHFLVDALLQSLVQSMSIVEKMKSSQLSVLTELKDVPNAVKRTSARVAELQHSVSDLFQGVD